MNHSKTLAEQIKADINLSDAKLSESYYYRSLPLCVTDAVFSIGVRYKSVQNTITHLSKYLKIQKYRQYGTEHVPQKQQLSVSEFINQLSDIDETALAQRVFCNMQRTSTKNGILKAVAVLQFAKILQRYNINYMQEVQIIDEKCIHELKEIKGLKSEIAIKYFFMLSGNDSYIKPDRMLLGYAKRHINDHQTKSDNEIEALLIEAIDILCNEDKTLTRRKVDHELWKYEREYRLAHKERLGQSGIS